MRFPMLEPQNEFMLTKRWREHGDPMRRTSSSPAICALVAKIAMGYRGYGLPTEGDVGLMPARAGKRLRSRHLRHVVPDRDQLKSFVRNERPPFSSR